MKICVQCDSEHADELERCCLCGGELRKRSVSDAINTLFEENSPEAAAAKVPCPHCGSKVYVRGSTAVCLNCGASVSRLEETENRTTSQALRP